MTLRRHRSAQSTIGRISWMLAAIPLFAPLGCQGMKDAMQGGMDKASSTADAQADSQAAMARGESPTAPTRSGAGPMSAGASGDSRGGRTATAGSETPIDAANAPDEGDRSMAATADTGTSIDAGGGAAIDAGGGADTGGGAARGEATITNQREDVQIGTEHWGWSDSKVGWFVRYQLQGGTEMTQEVVEATDDLILIENKTIMPGMDLPGSRTWQARLMVKYEGDATTDCTTESTELANEAITVGGTTVNCKVSEATTTCPGVTTHSKSWMSDEVPGELVKTMVNDQISMELIEFRK